MITLRQPYLLYVGDIKSPSDAKTAFGLKDWCPTAVLGEYAFGEAPLSLGLPTITPQKAALAGVGSLIIGVAPTGGQLPKHWVPDLVTALKSGVDVVSGLHSKLEDFPELYAASQQLGAGRLINVREPRAVYGCASGRKRRGRRVLTVGTDCAIGKKYTALAIAQSLEERGIAATFRATGQTGILISGSGIAMDAIKSDFVAGAAEVLSPDNEEHHWDVIEGQGSLYHPAYAAVTLGLLHGSQPDAIILCHDPKRTHIEDYPDYPIPDLSEAIDLYLRLGRLTNPWIRCVGLSINSQHLTTEQFEKYIQDHEKQLQIPVFDPMRSAMDSVIDVLLSAHAD